MDGTRLPETVMAQGNHQGISQGISTEKRLAALRARIHRIEAGSPGEDAVPECQPLGLADIDRHLPGGWAGPRRGA